MKLTVAAMALFLFTVVAKGQTAKVIELKPEEAVQAKQLADAVVAAQKAQEDFRTKIEQKYLVESVSPFGYFNVDKRGWGGGFIYSEDYRFIVPGNSIPAAPCSTGSWVGPAYATPNVYSGTTGMVGVQ